MRYPLGVTLVLLASVSLSCSSGPRWRPSTGEAQRAIPRPSRRVHLSALDRAVLVQQEADSPAVGFRYGVQRFRWPPM